MALGRRFVVKLTLIMCFSLDLGVKLVGFSLRSSPPGNINYVVDLALFSFESGR